MDVVLRLRELRRIRGLSQEEAARRARIGPKTLSSFESGARVDSMKLSQLLRLLDVYQLPPSVFFDDSLEPDDFTPNRSRLDTDSPAQPLLALPARARDRLALHVAAIVEIARSGLPARRWPSPASEQPALVS